MLDDAVATQDTVTQLVAAIRRVLRVVPGAEAVVLVGRETACDHKPGRGGREARTPEECRRKTQDQHHGFILQGQSYSKER